MLDFGFAKPQESFTCHEFSQYGIFPIGALARLKVPLGAD
jgi:hypothetical protein